MSTANIESILQSLGLTKKQAKVYLACLEYGPLGITDLARKSGERKSTTFDIVKVLIQEKFITPSQKGKKKIYLAESPKVIEEKYEQKLNGFKQVVPFLVKLESSQENKPIIKYYEGRSGVQQMLENILNIQEKVTHYWGSIKVLSNVVGDRYLKSWVRRRYRRGIRTQALRVKSDERKSEPLYSGQKELMREIRYPQIDILTGSNLAIYDNKVSFISSTKEGFAFVVESQEFSDTMKKIFNAFWEMSIPA